MDTQNPAMGSAQPSPGITQQDITGLRNMMMGMPLAQLQQFAQAHMNDPNGGIIVGMASQIANAKKAAAAPQQPQGSVAQQAVAGIAPPQAAPQMAPQAASQPQAAPAPQMLPENQGIAQLPAKNLEDMARGGIASYADGGSTSSNDGDSDSDDPANTGKYDPTTGMVPNMTADQAIAMGLPNALNYGPSMYYAKQGGKIPHFDGSDGSVVGPAVNPVFGRNSLTSAFSGIANPLLTANTRNRYGVNAPPAQPAAPVAPTPATTAAPPGEASYTPSAMPSPATTATLAAPAPTGIAASAPAPAAPSLGGIMPNTKGLAALYGSIGLTDKNLKQTTDSLKDSGLLPQQEDESTKAAIQGVKDAQEAMGYDPKNSKVYDRLDAMDKKSQDLADKQSALAIIQGGLAMIRSGNPWMAIAEGAGKGVADYSDAQEKLAKAQEQHGLARIAADQAANAMAHGDADTALKQQNEAIDRNLKKQDALLAAGVSTFNANQQARVATADALLQAQNQRDIANMQSQTQRDIWGQRSQAGVTRAEIMAQARNHPNYTQLYGQIAKTMPVGTSQAQIDAAVADHMMKANMLQNMGNPNSGIVSTLPTGVQTLKLAQ